MMMIARQRALAAGAAIPRRQDWLAVLLTFDEPCVSTHLFEVLGINRTDVAQAMRTADEDGWLKEPVRDFLHQELATVAQDLGHQYLGTEHLLLHFARADGAVGKQFRAAGLTWERIRDAFESIEWNAIPEP
jgi:hypothetical protein